MSQNILLNSTLHELLYKIDVELAEKARQNGCEHCGGALHHADYPRSPCGLPARLRDHYKTRISLCCGDCRKRTTPPSVRFFGRRWFVSHVFILISALMCGINERRLQQIKRYFGVTVSESTWKRWRRWWRETFVATAFWQQKKGFIVLKINSDMILPRALLNAFQGTLSDRLQRCLKFLSPLTGGKLRAV